MRSFRDGDTHMLTLAGELDLSAGPEVTHPASLSLGVQ